MNRILKLVSLFALLAVFSLSFATPASAFDGRSGERVIIESDEVVNDDLYVTAAELVLDGTVNGDLIAIGQTLTINGRVEGDVMAAGQTVVINGTVTGAVRMAGSVLLLAEGGSVGGDILGAGYSLEVQEGSSVGQDIVFAGGQLLIAGDVVRNMQVATGAFELRGAVGGNVQADVAEAGASAGPPPNIFMPPTAVSAPTVRPGFTIDPSARIEGNLEYMQTTDLAIPAGVVVGTVTRSEPATGQMADEETTGERVSRWGVNILRSSVTLILLGLLLLWLFPFFLGGSSTKLQTAFWPSLGWGVIAYAGFFIALLFTIIVVVLGGLLFGVLTLSGLAGTIISVGLLSLFVLILGFVLVTSFVAKIVFGQALGKWFLARANSPLAEHRYWPMVIGVIVIVLVVALLSFPLIPGILGWLLNFAIILFGLGALWLWSRERMARRPVTG